MTRDILGAFPEASSPPLSALEMELVPLDLVTEWHRCGKIADFMADYLVYGFERRDVARSVLSTVLNELVENAAKFSADKRAVAHVAVRQYSGAVHAEVRNEAAPEDVDQLRAVLSDVSRGDATVAFRRRIEGRSGLGLALLAKDYGATVGAKVAAPAAAGRIPVCLRVSLSAAEVEQR
jgi:hypothetical protein